MKSLKPYYKKLRNHDWFWYMSDDGKSYKQGQKLEKELEKEAMVIGSEAISLFMTFVKRCDLIVKGLPLPALPEEPR